MNFRTISILVFALSYYSVCSADDSFSDEILTATSSLIDEALASDHAYELVESLTTNIGPRLAGTPAEAESRRWAVDSLSQLGFSNIREDSFEIPGWVRGDETLVLLGAIPQEFAITALGYSVATPAAGLDAQIAYFASLNDLESAPREAVDGKIAFVDSYVTPTMDGSGVGVAYRAKSRGPNVAASKGASAALIRSIASGNERFPHTGTFRYDEGVPQIPVAAISAPDADQIRRLANLGELMSARLILTPRATGSVLSGNVLADIPGTDRADEIVLIGAHIDSWDLGTGAIDDGTGVATAIAAANMIQDMQLPLSRTIRVVLFGAEEVTLGGAKDYAIRYEHELSRYVVAIESDFGAAPVWGFYSNVPDHLLPTIDRIAEIIGPRLNIVRRHNSASGGEDLTYIRQKGVPVVSLAQDGTHYFDYHHTANDTLDKVDPVALQQNVAAYAAFIYLVANFEATVPSSSKDP